MCTVRSKHLILTNPLQMHTGCPSKRNVYFLLSTTAPPICKRYVHVFSHVLSKTWPWYGREKITNTFFLNTLYKLLFYTPLGSWIFVSWQRNERIFSFSTFFFPRTVKMPPKEGTITICTAIMARILRWWQMLGDKGQGAYFAFQNKN